LELKDPTGLVRDPPYHRACRSRPPGVRTCGLLHRPIAPPRDGHKRRSFRGHTSRCSAPSHWSPSLHHRAESSSTRCRRAGPECNDPAHTSRHPVGRE
jgi:hypothetical protein